MKEKNDKESFAERIRKAADSIGGQAELSRRTGISKVSIGAYASGKSDPSRERLILIAKATGYSLLWLATGSDTESQQSGKTLQCTDDHGKYEKIRISEKLQKTAEILESETIYRTALAANIDAFHHAVAQDNQVRKNEKELAAQQKRIADLESRIVSLEKLLSSVSATPGDYQKKNKDNAA